MAAARRLSRPAALALATAAVLAGCGGSGGNRPTVATVGRGEVKQVVEAPASIVAKASATVSSPADGRVATLLVHDGQQVKAGQTLMVLSSPTAQQRLKGAKAADAKAAQGAQPVPPTDLTGLLAGSDASADSAFTAAQQAINALPAGAAKASAQSQLNDSEARYRSARSQAQQAIQSLDAGIGGLSRALDTVAQAQRTQTRAAVTLAEQAVAALTVKAPVAGTVQLGGEASSGGAAGGLAAQISALPSSVQGQAQQLLGGGGNAQTTTTTVEVGTPVTAGSALATVTDASTLSLDADVDETDVLAVHTGATATVDLDAVPGATYTATVRTVGSTPTTSAEGGVTYRVRLALGRGTQSDGSTAPRPRPGMSAVADILVRDAKNAVSVPSSALVHDGDRVYVWVDANGTARKAYLTLGAQGDSNVQVVHGVDVGARIVTKGAENVTEGQKLPR